jgi:hypothetical protein
VSYAVVGVPANNHSEQDFKQNIARKILLAKTPTTAGKKRDHT